MQRRITKELNELFDHKFPFKFQIDELTTKTYKLTVTIPRETHKELKEDYIHIINIKYEADYPFTPPDVNFFYLKHNALNALSSLLIYKEEWSAACTLKNQILPDIYRILAECIHFTPINHPPLLDMFGTYNANWPKLYNSNNNNSTNFTTY
jgi:ubiquitin-protein ligase